MRTLVTSTPRWSATPPATPPITRPPDRRYIRGGETGGYETGADGAECAAGVSDAGCAGDA
ncbi:hypothetical protein GCM10023147_48860 [Tsukamurella soli]|uniref:Uncharacterized protein n=1 Tax=Tsukamurella soli TaxID=644556 RepID=A0ABP8KEW6_9ACTN